MWTPNGANGKAASGILERAKAILFALGAKIAANLLLSLFARKCPMRTECQQAVHQAQVYYTAAQNAANEAKMHALSARQAADEAASGAQIAQAAAAKLAKRSEKS